MSGRPPLVDSLPPKPRLHLGTMGISHRALAAEAIDHALAARTDLPESERAEIQALRDQGLQQHEAGDHRASEATLAEAMRRLLLAE